MCIVHNTSNAIYQNLVLSHTSFRMKQTMSTVCYVCTWSVLHSNLNEVTAAYIHHLVSETNHHGSCLKGMPSERKLEPVNQYITDTRNLLVPVSSQSSPATSSSMQTKLLKFTSTFRTTFFTLFTACINIHTNTHNECFSWLYVLFFSRVKK